jgi:undecaprenyl diphosphate synthase
MALNKNNNCYVLPEKLPQHIGFIMDGNGRWAKKRFLPRYAGHIEGAKTFRKILRYCGNIGIKCVSFYAFSTENWKRSSEEVNAIMKLFNEYLDDVKEIFDEQIRVIFLGDKSALSDMLREKMLKLEHDTKDFKRMTLLLAINYGGRDEIVHASKLIAEKVRKNEISPDDITEEYFEKFLYTAGMPDVDLLIRPSGELRLSNYLIWQTAYAEYYFTDVLWPDFKPEHLDEALRAYAQRGRRFGGV